MGSQAARATPADRAARAVLILRAISSILQSYRSRRCEPKNQTEARQTWYSNIPSVVPHIQSKMSKMLSRFLRL